MVRLPDKPPVLSGFSYVRPLGTGGFADVFLFEQDMPRRQVAVKVLLHDILDDDLLRMFNAEADIMAQLSTHPSILTIHQAGISSDGRPYLVMEYCTGSMTNRYRQQPLSVTEALTTGVKMGSALETVHRAGLLHRDIKPSNILITAFGAPLLSDFGIARSLSPRGENEMLAMSVPWSAPEIVYEQIPGSIPSEVWSLGATVYSLLAGRSPFEKTEKRQNSREQVKHRIRRASYTPLTRTDIPDSLNDVLRRSMSKDVTKRQVSAAQFAYELQLVQNELGMSYTPLELADDQWARAAAEHVSFNDAAERGPKRSTVHDPGRRRSGPRARSSAIVLSDVGEMRIRSTESGPKISGVLLAILIGVGSCAVAAAVIMLVIVLGGQ